jgi:hypothetical protein
MLGFLVKEKIMQLLYQQKIVVKEKAVHKLKNTIAGAL